MNIMVYPLEKGLFGELKAPGSKSYTHRAFIAAALAKGDSRIENPLISGDTNITLQILNKLGIIIEKVDINIFKVHGVGRSGFQNCSEIIDCQNSGTSIRIFSALSLLVEGGLTFKGEFFERNRPLLPLLESLENLGAKYEFESGILSIFREKTKCNSPISIPGNISSQFITALLYLCPILKCRNKKMIHIEVFTPFVSYPYILITLNVLNAFNIKIKEVKKKDMKTSFITSLNQNYKPADISIPGDFSSAAFIIAATILNPYKSKIEIKNLDCASPQGDKHLISILKNMGAKINTNRAENSIIVYGNIQKNPLKGTKIDCEEIPDLFPILSIIGIFAEGKTVLYNAKSLRGKESDRIRIMSRELQKMGVKVIEKYDSLTIFPMKRKMFINKFNHENDHRIAMALCIACLYLGSPILLENMEIVKDSYPKFIDDLKNLGVKIRKI